MNNNLFLLNQDTLNDLKNNINLEDYDNLDNSAIIERLNITSLPTVPQLIVSDSSNKSKDDLENSITLYETWKDIPLSLASDERFWTFLTHTVYWNYMQRRWPIDKLNKEKQANLIKNRYFFGSKKAYRNGLSRLWWYAHLTYNSTKKDPYYYTEIILTDQEYANQLIESTNIARNKVALKAILSALKDFDELEKNNQIEPVKDKRENILRGLMQHVTLVGGVTVWDALTEEEAYKKAWIYIESKITRLPQPTS